jgi:hypothetical protein
MEAWDYYHIVVESPEYPLTGNLVHSESIEDAESWMKTPENKGIADDMANWVKRGIVEYFWHVRYELIKSFRSGTVSTVKEDTIIENAPIMHIEAYCFSTEEEERYGKWLREYGFNVFMPLFMNLLGLKGYDCFKYLGSVSTGNAKETKYPLYLSIVYFENMKAFENYTKSAELVVFQKGLRNVFPRGPVYKWYVQYRLVQSLRK